MSRIGCRIAAATVAAIWSAGLASHAVAVDTTGSVPGYQSVLDDLALLTVEAPDTWSEIETRPIVSSDLTITRPHLEIAPDLTAWRARVGVGVSVVAFSFTDDLAGLIETYASHPACAEGEQYDSAGNTNVSYVHTFVDCGGVAGREVYFEAINPPHQGYTLLVAIGTEPGDDAFFDTVVSTARWLDNAHPYPPQGATPTPATPTTPATTTTTAPDPPGQACGTYTDPGNSYPFGLCDSGSNVATIQSVMVEWLGYDMAVDGFFGLRTEAGVRDYQARNGLAVDGLVGPGTWHAMTGGTPPWLTDVDGNGVIDPWEFYFLYD